GMYVNARFKVKLGSEGVIFDSKIRGKYMCPMHPEVISDKEDNCPECGMKLEPIGGRAGVFVPGLIPQVYECPMKCEGAASDKPGNCPKCELVLIKKEVEGVQEEKAVYVCSEHIDEQSGLPGECPVCQRKLKIKTRDDIGVLAVPHSAVLFTGKRNIVYVEKEKGNYVPREVIIGPKADEYYPVISGLSAGEKVVTSGTFLIDSQMQLLGKPSLLFPEGSALDKPIEEKKDENKEVHKEENKNTTAVTISEPGLKKTMEGILNNYYSVAVMIANDSTEGIDENLDLIVRNSKKVRDMDLDTPEDSFERLSEIANKIEDGATKMKGMKLEEARKSFKDLSQSVIKFLKEFHGKIKGVEKAYVYYCPMADASWLQKEEGTRNPYYGSKMLKCGSVREIIP
ncbi:MAG: heavy metal-binding domain-containing protein, partial [Candidatus Scalinduaceae bacterium]